MLLLLLLLCLLDWSVSVYSKEAGRSKQAKAKTVICLSISVCLFV
jgi:hypothetical protein